MSTIKGLATLGQGSIAERMSDGNNDQKGRVVDWIRPVDIRGWAGKAQHEGGATD